ncbi:uridylyltransferase [Actinobacillus pleuropneumoniae serovar 3 str. JL03]|uniref:Bifunctional uridylyltransferase/uridylyl-removing enzyme n=1 Tax=Actinobacillus pleuropneumoniae serotype 3 (strain JL03) TaxID=434271 RepID=B0BUF7_ACTPJ|nr:bifunctional uridylyltransferase/uridylyl-removing protein GlnD [Actinobacillus pleuropneumoniae]ABY69162.1 uridylyltransferase [Actinobacillus pleuropneumoniae serovar 3 str. JL03]UKH14136.1 bifunctional uridylyltransferase/uridylyl-removing protein GlnD [Actinobacillus pleuropneumoniae]UKH22308.1 bifunctional uridylyltransferase/uridylyl-removing protein GlnD [Actinobacillus pleuropneumoniae]UKH43313.1 bifunctional uridylyltransferase/uridylyl-removing protein GlnD [Actinobacillus pleuropn
MNIDVKSQLAEFNTKQRHDFSQEDAFELIYQRSDFYDELLVSLWRQFGFEKRSDMALIAVGGYGRREMFPLSDVDILVLTEQSVDEETAEKLNALFNALWDCKLQVGASIRTLFESLDIGREEISVATNIYEGRFLTGNKKLWTALVEQIYQADYWPIEAFFQAKIEEKNERYARYHNTSYNLEPDLKHNPGGLRDLHLVSWIFLRHFGTYSFESLLNKGILFAEEFKELNSAQAVLFRMRFALHLQLKRYDNRLRFDRQLQLSELLGYQGEGNQPVEAMMKSYFQATQAISQLSQLLLNSFEQQVLRPKNNLEKQPLDQYFYLQGSEIYCQDRRCFTHTPTSILDLFFYLTQYPDAKASATMLRHLRLALHKLGQPLSELPEARTRFIRLFEQPNVVKKAIVPMHQLGVLTAYLPQWRHIVGLMQFDLFHIYTVDEHTIRVMLKIESFLDAETTEQHPLCCQYFTACQHKPLLYFAALFHDIAKGREGDHAEVGALDMEQFALQHGFDPIQVAKMVWLVREHLTMSITAQRRDIHDPFVIKAFAEKVENRTALSDLMCLTVADICATNETLWNDWKRSLFAQLFQFTNQQLTKSLDYRKEAETNRQQALELIKFALKPDERTCLQQFWQVCPDSYFLRHKPKQLVWHALAYLKQRIMPLVLVSNEYARGATEIFIYCEDQAQLFLRIAQILSQKKVSIHDAQIITSQNGLVLDSFIVTELNGKPLEEMRCEQIKQSLEKVLNTSEPKVCNLERKPVKHQSFKRQTKVRFLADSQQNRTAFELFTLDREGLLARVSSVFNQLGLNLINAKITTIGERVEDFFVVTTQQHQALDDKAQKALKSALLDELSE